MNLNVNGVQSGNFTKNINSIMPRSPKEDESAFAKELKELVEKGMEEAGISKPAFENSKIKNPPILETLKDIFSGNFKLDENSIVF